MKEIKYGDGSVSNFRLGNFATGSYFCKCRKCGIEFIGDKRAFVCLKCQIEVVDELLASNSSNSCVAVITKIAGEIERRHLLDSMLSPSQAAALEGWARQLRNAI